MPRLIAILPNGARAEFDLKPGRNVIGRAAGNDFVVPDPSVSGAHCEILVNEDQVLLRDLKSTNGSYVDKAPVHEATLKNGQTVHLGGVQMTFRNEGPSPAAPAGPPEQRPAPASAPKRVSTMAIPVRMVARPPATVAPVSTVPSENIPGAGPADPALLAIPKPTLISPAPPSPVSARPPAPAINLARPVLPPAAAPAPMALAVPPPVTPPSVTESAAGPLAIPEHCKSHPRIPAAFLCTHCGNGFCELCVDTRTISGLPHRYCRHCGTECATLAPTRPPQKRVQNAKGFFAQLPSAFEYPFHGSGILVMVFAAILLGAISFLSRFSFFFLIIGNIVVLGYFFGYMQAILHSTAAGDNQLPEPGGISDWWEDILLPCLRLIGVGLVSFGPALLLSYWAAPYALAAAGGAPGGLPPMVVVLIPFALLFGCAYMPMAFLSTAMLDTIVAANPLTVFAAIFKVPLQYLVAVLVVGFVFVLEVTGDGLIQRFFRTNFTTRSAAALIAPLLVKAVWNVASLYFLLVSARIMGLLFVCNRERLGWFRG